VAAYLKTQFEPDLEDPDSRRVWEMGNKVQSLYESLSRRNSPAYGPLNGAGLTTIGAVFRELPSLDPNCLLNPMREEYVRFLHRLTTLGLIETKKWLFRF